MASITGVGSRGALGWSEIGTLQYEGEGRGFLQDGSMKREKGMEAARRFLECTGTSVHGLISTS